MKLTPQQTENFQRDGFVVLESIVPREMVERAKQSAIRLIFEGDEQPLNWVAELGRESSQVGRMRPLNVTQKRAVMTREMFDVVCYEPAYHAASQLLDDTKLQLNQDSVLYSFRYESQKEVPQRVHLDSGVPDDFAGYPRSITCFTYLTDVAENGGAVCLLPGGHERVRRIKLERPKMNHSWGDRPDWHDECVPIAAPAGSIIMFHQLMPHRISYNRQPRARVSLLFNFAKVGDAGTYGSNTALNPEYVPHLSPLYRKLFGLDKWPG